LQRYKVLTGTFQPIFTPKKYELKINFASKATALEMLAWASADFFPGKGKKFPGGGQEPTFCLKNNKKDTIFPKKV
jgi:hypothetical protein